jgi:uncharacterized protein
MKAQRSDPKARLSSILLEDPWHRETLETLRDTAPFAWITGGFVRNAIWDAIFEKDSYCMPADVDVIYLTSVEMSSSTEREIRGALSQRQPDASWSVKDQSRMHKRGGDAPYRSLHEALRAFPDRSSASAVRLLTDGNLQTLAPYGLEDVFRGVVRPTPAGLSDGRYEAFLNKKLAGWRKRWPRLMVASITSRERPSRRAA